MKPRLPTWTLLVAFAGLAAIANGCGEDFAPYNRVNTLRVLAVRSTPVAPATGETTTLDALVYNPTGGPVTYRWSWCPFTKGADNGYECPSQAEAEAQLGLDRVGLKLPPLDLGREATAKFTNDLDPALLELACRALNNDAVGDRCAGGLAVTVRLTITGDKVDEKGVVAAEKETVDVVRTLRLRFRADQPPNLNPTIRGLSATFTVTDDPPDGGEPAKTSRVIAPLDEAATVQLRRKVDNGLLADVPESAAEIYRVKGAAADGGAALADAGVNEGEADAGATEDGMAPDFAQERMTLTWFVESGDTKVERTSFIPPPNGNLGFAQALINEWKPAVVKDYPATTSRVIVVVRDDREGVAWTTAAATLLPELAP